MSMGWNSLRIQNMLFGLLAAALLQAVMHPSWFWLCFFNGIFLDSFFSLEGGLSSHCQPKVWDCKYRLVVIPTAMMKKPKEPKLKFKHKSVEPLCTHNLPPESPP